MKIEKLNLSKRVYQLLKRKNINTIEQLKNMNDDDLYNMNGLGEESLKEIKHKLKVLQMINMTADMKVQIALHDFENTYNIRPNRIVMGHKLSDELTKKFYRDVIPINILTELAKEKNLGLLVEYEGIPVKIDYDNPNVLEVGYMTNWTE